MLIVDSSIPGWLHVGARGHWVGRLLVLWILEFWLRTSRRVDTTMEQVVANLQQQLSSQQQAIQQLSTMLENQQASSAERETALKAQLSDMLERWNRDAADVEVRPEVEPEHGTPRRHRAFVESRAFSNLVNFDSKAASWKNWAFKLENMAAAVIPSSRDTLDWAAQQDTPILNVDDVEAGPDSVEINPQVYVALAELLEGEALDIVQNTTRGAGLEAWRKLVRRFDLQTVGRKRTLLSRIINPGTVTVHELSRVIEQWEERVRSYQSRAREKKSDDVRSGILTEMCPEHIKTHIHLNLTRLPDYASVRSEIETFLEARQSSSNPDAMDIGKTRKSTTGMVLMRDAHCLKVSSHTQSTISLSSGESEYYGIVPPACADSLLVGTATSTAGRPSLEEGEEGTGRHECEWRTHQISGRETHDEPVDNDGLRVQRWAHIVGARVSMTIDIVFSSMVFSAARFFESSGVAQWYSGTRMLSRAMTEDKTRHQEKWVEATKENALADDFWLGWAAIVCFLWLSDLCVTQTAHGTPASQCLSSSPSVFSLSPSISNLFMFTLLPQHLPSSYWKDWATWGGEAEPRGFDGLCRRSKEDRAGKTKNVEKQPNGLEEETSNLEDRVTAALVICEEHMSDYQTRPKLMSNKAWAKNQSNDAKRKNLPNHCATWMHPCNVLEWKSIHWKNGLKRDDEVWDWWKSTEKETYTKRSQMKTTDETRP